MLPRFGRRRPGLAEPVSSDEAEWASADFTKWSDRGVTAERVAAEADRLNALAPTIYRLDILGPTVTVAPKIETPGFSEPFRLRVDIYRRLLEAVVRLHGIDIRASMMLEAFDQVASVSDMPIVGFQRTRGANTLLLPDVELVENFNASADVHDDIPWEQKQPQAIFTGSTTGGWSDENSVRARALPRLAAAEYFRSSSRVRWELPNVVQCASPQTERLIRSLGFGEARRSWQEQFGYRVLLSMDGNGATCSRVSIGLASHCLLGKFDSPEELYYFRALRAGKHYVPLTEFADVDRLLDDMQERPSAYKAVADAASAFAHRHLTRIAVYAYVAEFLVRYGQLLAGEPVDDGARVRARPPSHAELVVTLDDGSRRLGSLNGWTGSPRSGRAIKKLGLALAPGMPPDVIRLHGIDASGAVTSTSSEGQEAHGLDGGLLRGVAAEIAPSYREVYAASVDAIFLDGHTCVEARHDRIAKSPTGAPLEAVKLSVARR